MINQNCFDLINVKKYNLFDITQKIIEFLSRQDFLHIPCMKEFPKECCYYSSFFIVLMLEHMGFDIVYWVWGTRRSTGSHIWCEYGECVIDLTLGQYSDGLTEYSVYNKRTGYSEFHSSFEIVKKGHFDQRFRQGNIYLELIQKTTLFFSAHMAAGRELEAVCLL